MLLPRWDFTAAWNSGEPRFVFYPPLSWMMGAALGLLLPWVAVPTVFLWLVLTAAGFTMYRLAREWTTPGGALIAACFYMVNPYMLFTLYERAAYAELLAAAWIPLLLLGILQRRLTVYGIAIPICLLWLSNDPAAVIGCYSFGLLGLIRMVSCYRGAGGRRACLCDAARIAGGAVLGMGLAGFYLVPATVEQYWVRIAMPFLRGVRYQDNFAFGHIGNASHDAILRTASLCGVTLLLLSAVFAVVALTEKRLRQEHATPDGERGTRTVVGALCVLTCGAGFLLTAPSSVIWRHLPELKFLQFPWRFCTVLGATAAALLAMALRRSRLGTGVGAATAFALTLTFTLAGNHFFRQPRFAASDVPGIVHEFYQGGDYDPTDEYTPVGADSTALDHANAMYWVAARATDAGPQTRAGYSVALARRLHFNVSSATAGFVVISLRNYPAWRITINGHAAGALPHRRDGLIVLPMHRGSSTIDIRYARTMDETMGWIISMISGVLLLLIWWLSERRQRDGACAALLMATRAS